MYVRLCKHQAAAAIFTDACISIPQGWIQVTCNTSYSPRGTSNTGLMCQYGRGVFPCFVSRYLSQRCPFKCQDTPKWTCTPANPFFLFIHQQIEGHRFFASWDICKCDMGGGGRECVFWGRECSRPGLQDGSDVLEPSRFYCAFMRARKSFISFLLIPPFYSAPQNWCPKCASL